MKIFISFLFVMFLSSCSSKKTDPNSQHQKATQNDTIQVGMTYNEVKELKGNPTAIERGIREISSGNTIESSDKILYVTWSFHNQTKIDTTHTNISYTSGKPTKRFRHIVSRDYCVIFDAASGRVVRFGYYPFDFTETKIE